MHGILVNIIFELCELYLNCKQQCISFKDVCIMLQLNFEYINDWAYYYLYNTFVTCFAVYPNVTSIRTTSVHVITGFPVATVTTRLFARYTIRTSITSRWTTSVLVMTRFPVATFTTQFLTFLTIRVIAAFCKGLTTYRHSLSKQQKQYIKTNNRAHEFLFSREKQFYYTQDKAEISSLSLCRHIEKKISH